MREANLAFALKGGQTQGSPLRKKYPFDDGLVLGSIRNAENFADLCRDTACRARKSRVRFEANQARLQMGVLAYNLLHMIRQFYVWGEEVKRSMEWLIKRLIKVGARISYHARRWYVHVASAFPLAHHYRAVLAWGS